MLTKVPTANVAAEHVDLDDAPAASEWRGVIEWRRFRYRTRYDWRGWRTHLARKKRRERREQKEA